MLNCLLPPTKWSGVDVQTESVLQVQINLHVCYTACNLEIGGFAFEGFLRSVSVYSEESCQSSLGTGGFQWSDPLFEICTTVGLLPSSMVNSLSPLRVTGSQEN